MASREIIFVFLTCILLVNSAYLPFEGQRQDRFARSPHCWSCEQDNGYPPPHFYGFHHHPNFRSQQWSGLSRSPDGEQQVFSGAAASAGEGNQNSGDSQAISLASAGAGETKGGVQEANPLKSSFSGKNNQGTNLNSNNQQQLGTIASAKQSSGLDTQQANVDRDGGNRENLQQSGGYDTSAQNIETFGHSAYGKGNPGQQYKMDQQQVKYGEHGSDLQQGRYNSGAPTQYQTDFINHEQRPTNYGNGRYRGDAQQIGAQNDHNGRSEITLNEQQNQDSQDYIKRGYGDNVQQAQMGIQRDQTGRPGNNYDRRYTDHLGMQQQQNRRPDENENDQQVQNSLSQSQASSSGYGNQGQFKENYNDENLQEQQNSASSVGHGDRKHFKQRYHGENTQQQNSVQENSHDSLSGALSLASQGLEGSQKLPESGCTNCEGKGSIAYSNAKSKSGSAVALSIGG